jgi:hypothetical protein
VWTGRTWLRIGTSGGPREHSNEPSISIKGEEFPNLLSEGSYSMELLSYLTMFRHFLVPIQPPNHRVPGYPFPRDKRAKA